MKKIAQMEKELSEMGAPFLEEEKDDQLSPLCLFYYLSKITGFKNKKLSEKLKTKIEIFLLKQSNFDITLTFSNKSEFLPLNLNLYSK